MGRAGKADVCDKLVYKYYVYKYYVYKYYVCFWSCLLMLKYEMYTPRAYMRKGAVRPGDYQFVFIK